MDSMERLLDTKGSCFLCLRGSLSSGDNMDAVSEINLQKICHYLNINPSSIVRNTSRGNSLEENRNKELSQKEERDFSVTLCPACSSVTRKLIDLISELEQIRGFLTYQLQRLHECVIDADTNSKDKVKLGCYNLAEDNLADTLRARIKERCSKKVKEVIQTSFPKVLLERLEPEIPEEPLLLTEEINDDAHDSLIHRSPLIITENSIISPSPFQEIPILVPECDFSNDESETEMLLNSDPLKCLDPQSDKIIMSNCSSSSTLVTSIVPKLDNEMSNALESSKTKSKREDKWVCRKAEGGCGKHFINKANLLFHKKRHCQSLGRKELWTCDLAGGGCGRLFSNKHNLNRHQQKYCSKRRGDSGNENEMESEQSEESLCADITNSVENVVINKVEIMENHEQNIMIDFEQIF